MVLTRSKNKPPDLTAVLTEPDTQPEEVVEDVVAETDSSGLARVSEAETEVDSDTVVDNGAKAPYKVVPPAEIGVEDSK